MISTTATPAATWCRPASALRAQSAGSVGPRPLPTPGEEFEVAIVGGGPAGLSAALVLARARRHVALLDAGAPRNRASRGVSGFLSRDGILPAELAEIGRRQIAGYGSVELVGQRAVAIEASPGPSFAIATDARRTIRARQLVLALGVIDEKPAIEGFDELWGSSVIHCPFCDGWERAGGRWAVLASGADDVAMALRCTGWTDDVTLIAPRRVALSEADAARALSRGLRVVRGSVRRLVEKSGVLCGLELDRGERIGCDTLVHQPAQRQTPLVESLGLELDGASRVRVDGWQRTSAEGILAAGDLTPGPQSVANASAEGSRAGMAVLAALCDAPMP